MKTIIKIFTAVLAVVPVLVSCYSEPLPEVIPEVIPEDGDNGSEQDSTVRVITVSFNTKATRTVLGTDGFTPEFSEGDEIYVANGTGHEIPKVEYKNIGGKKVATISTTLSGALKLVYPSNCAKLGHIDVINEGTDEEKIWVQDPDEIAGIIVPPRQVGTFENANICMAEMEAGATKATFYNQTAVFVIDVPEGTKQLIVTSLRTINQSTGQRYTASEDADDEKWATICRKWNGDDFWYSAGRTITIGYGTSAIPDPCFVSIMVEEDDEVLLRDLHFDVRYRFDGENNGVAGTMGGFSPFFLDGIFGAGSADTKTVQKGAIYSGVEDHLHDYISAGNVSWATVNIGASSPSDRGLFFGWGATTGHEYNVTSAKFEPIYGESGYAFTWSGIPFGDSADDVETLNNICCDIIGNNGSHSFVLPLEFDAAYYNWGGAWRMPRTNDQMGFSQDFVRTYDYGVSSSVRGDLSFQPAGHSNTSSGNTLVTETNATFWTSSFDKSYNTRAFYLTYAKNDVSFSTASTVNNGGTRWVGHVIRPVVGSEIQ